MLSEYEFTGVRASESGIPSDLAHGAAPSSGGGRYIDIDKHAADYGLPGLDILWLGQSGAPLVVSGFGLGSPLVRVLGCRICAVVEKALSNFHARRPMR